MKPMHSTRLILLSLLLAGLGVSAFSSSAASTTRKSSAAGRKHATTRKISTTSKKTASSKKAVSSKKTATATKSKTSATKSKTAATSSHRGKSSKRTSSRRQTGQKAPTPERVSEIQQALAKDGSFSGTPSGKWDTSTVDAMKKFQAAHGLNASGKLDAKTLQQLGLGSHTAGMGAPTPPVRVSSANVTPAETLSNKQ
ncbi:MAG TPA: peptidoglycan-binding domain-containing protein [Candidatus Acidoferrum sp.]|jgi:peptidoglycan hydrolase-like protein with peptidoglycan-binding domain